MLELISIGGTLLLCILTPVEVARSAGRVRKKFAGIASSFLITYRK